MENVETRSKTQGMSKMSNAFEQFSKKAPLLVSLFELDMGQDKGQ